MAVISIDPSRRKSGGALLGDRIRMNAIGPWQPGRARLHAQPGHARLRQRDQPGLPDVVAACKAPASTWSIVETSGIGQGDAAIVPLVDVPMYVMTPEFGAASQLEKIDMLDFAEFVAINKFDRKGAADALRDVAKQVQRNKRGLHHAAGADAGVRHHGQPLQRRRRDRAVPGAAAAPGGAGPEARRGAAAAGGHAPQHAPDAGRAAGARALPGRDRRHRARLQAPRPPQARLAREVQQLREAPACCTRTTRRARGRRTPC
jgi:methylmalonyl-CoA mutase